MIALSTYVPHFACQFTHLLQACSSLCLFESRTWIEFEFSRHRPLPLHEVVFLRRLAVVQRRPWRVDAFLAENLCSSAFECARNRVARFPPWRLVTCLPVCDRIPLLVGEPSCIDHTLQSLSFIVMLAWCRTCELDRPCQICSWDSVSSYPHLCCFCVSYARFSLRQHLVVEDTVGLCESGLCIAV